MAEHTAVQSVDKAMTLLEILLARRAPMTLQELSAASGYPKSTTHALLATMRTHAVIEQHSDGRYALGIRLFECGCAVSSAWDIGRLAHPHLEQLAAVSGASAFLALLEGCNAISFDQCISDSGLQVVPAIGGRMPLHATSQGKVLLSGRSDREVLRILEKGGMQAFTPHTITDPRRFVSDLAAVRQQGYAGSGVRQQRPYALCPGCGGAFPAGAVRGLPKRHRPARSSGPAALHSLGLAGIGRFPCESG